MSLADDKYSVFYSTGDGTILLVVSDKFGYTKRGNKRGIET